MKIIRDSIFGFNELKDIEKYLFLMRQSLSSANCIAAGAHFREGKLKDKSRKCNIPLTCLDLF